MSAAAVLRRNLTGSKAEVTIFYVLKEDISYNFDCCVFINIYDENISICLVILCIIILHTRYTTLSTHYFDPL